MGLECTIFRETGGAMRTYSDCVAAAGAGTASAPCTTEDDCAGGYTCVDLMSPGRVCTHWCAVTSGAGCPASDTCAGFVTPVTVNGVEYGVCT